MYDPWDPKHTVLGCNKGYSVAVVVAVVVAAAVAVVVVDSHRLSLPY